MCPVSRDAGVVGRRDELEVVERFVRSVGDAVSALTIAGPAGIGKTTVWRAGVRTAEDGGLRVLVARPTGVEASLSYAGLADILEPVDAALLDDLPGPQRRALGVALLREEVAGDRVDLRAVSTATCAVLRELAAERPILLAVDDAQFLDEATAGALRFALRRLEDSAVAVLASVRHDQYRPDTFELALPEDRRAELDLTPLSVAAMHEVIRSRLGRSLSRPLVVKIVERSGGNAFFAIEMARELIRLDEDTPDGLSVPPSMQGLVRTRVRRYSASTREALLLASALVAPTTTLVPADDLLAAEDDGLVQIDRDGRIVFEHPLVAAAIYESAPRARRRAAHRLLARRADDKEERARHLALAAEGPDAAVAAQLDEAATHTAARGASAAAAELAALAFELTPTLLAEARVERALTLAHYLLDSGDSGAARRVLEAFDPRSVEGDLRASLLRELGRILWYEGEHEQGYRLLCEALEHSHDPKLAARAHSAAAWLLHDRDLDRAIEHADAAVALLGPDESPGPYSWALLLGAYLRLVNGEGADDGAYRRGRELQTFVVDWEDTSPVLGMWPVFADDFADAKQFYDRGLERSRAEGDVTSVQGTLLRLVEIACWTGCWEEADRLAAEGLDLAERTGTSAYLGSALYARAFVDAHLGRADEARSAADRVVELFAGSLQGALGHWVLGFVALSLGDAASADLEYSRASGIVDTLGQREPARFRFYPDHIEAVVILGELDRAETMLAALEARAEVLPRPWILATGARCRALLLGASGDLDGALAASEHALRHHDELQMPFERARTTLVQGGVLRRLKQKRRSRSALEDSVATFESLGATLWAAIAREELRRTAARRAPLGLTATELQIARLAASGLSNPEIAAQAFVSRKTVEANLGRAYRKLGVSSRVQLALALDREAETIS